jgi:PPP family 3-phenylpropionic acid transporter
MKENGKCCLLMGVYYMIICIVFSFAAYYLYLQGFTSRQTGLIISSSCVVGAFLQPVSGRLADSDPKWSWKNQLLLLSALALAVSMLRIFMDGLIWEGACYILLFVLVLVMMPLVNSSCFYYKDRGISVDYGVVRGVGSISYAATSLLFGWLTAMKGPQVLALCLAVLFALLLAAAFIMPLAGGPQNVRPAEIKNEQSTKNFISAYPAVILMAAGITLGCVFHNMVATYMFDIMREAGGDSGTMGTAIAIGGAMELPALFLYTRIKEKSGLSAAALICIGCLMFVVKGVLLAAASGVVMIYFIQLLQGPSYGIVTAAKAAYAHETVAAGDETTGQAVMSMTDSFSIVAGSMLGGMLLSGGSAGRMLVAGTAMAAAGTIITIIAAKKGGGGMKHE